MCLEPVTGILIFLIVGIQGTGSVKKALCIYVMPTCNSHRTAEEEPFGIALLCGYSGKQVFGALNITAVDSYTDSAV